MILMSKKYLFFKNAKITKNENSFLIIYVFVLLLYSASCAVCFLNFQYFSLDQYSDLHEITQFSLSFSPLKHFL